MVKEKDGVKYWEDAQGRLVPESNVKEIDKQRDEIVREMVEKAISVHDHMAKCKKHAFNTIGAFVELSAERYGVKVGGSKGNVVLHSFDGRYKIIRQVSERIQFDEQIVVAKKLIDECLIKWSKGANVNIISIINDAFSVDKKGNINVNRILSLKKLEINDPDWQKAMEAISNSIYEIDSASYVRFFIRNDETGEYDPIVLDFASV